MLAWNGPFDYPGKYKANVLDPVSVIFYFQSDFPQLLGGGSGDVKVLLELFFLAGRGGGN